jgi:bla regulator protein BlaR1
MSFSVLTGCALAAAAAAADRLASHSQRPRRFIWLTALVATACWPVISVVRTALVPLRASPISDSDSLAEGAHRLSSFIVTAPWTAIAPNLTLALLVAWALLSTFFMARLAVAIWYIRRRRGTWRETEVDGMHVQLAPDAGPAVVGLRPMEVVLPEWVLELEPPLRALVLRHESEHRLAGDPYLLLVATLVTALIPWNVALWWQARRLRLAIEIDCDARVLRVHPHRRQYAHLLLTIAERRVEGMQRLAPALSEPTSNLEWRIIAMRTTHTPSLFRVVWLSVMGTAAFALACAVDTPATPDRSNSPRSVAQHAEPVVSSAQSVDPASNVFFEFQVKQPVAQLPGGGIPRYPAALRAAGVEGEVQVQFVVNQDGKADPSTLKVLRATSELFSAAVTSAVPQMRFSAAEVGGHKVKQLVQQSFQFKLDRRLGAR